MKLTDEEIENWARDHAMKVPPLKHSEVLMHLQVKNSYAEGMKKARELYEGEISRLQSRLELHEIRY